MSRIKVSDEEIRRIVARQHRRKPDNVRARPARIHAMVGAPVRPRQLSSTERAIYLLIGK